MVSRAELSVSRSLQTILTDLPNGASIPHSEQRQDLFDGLEYFVAEVLRTISSEWEKESLDGFCPLVVRKTGNGELELFGLCYLLTDQRLTPIHLRIQSSEATEEVSWFDCKLGEAGEGGMIRIPRPVENGTSKIVRSLEGRADTIEWVYKVTFGQRRL